MKMILGIIWIQILALGLFLRPSAAFLLDEKCPSCHWNGVCNTRSGQCVCYDGYHGDDCSVDCGCNGHGVCNTDNTCQCDHGWKWSTTKHQCVWDCLCVDGAQCMGPGVCDCKQQCQYGTCWNGQCECWEGFKGSTCSVHDPNIMLNSNVSVGVNLGGLSYWSPELKFVDVAKQSQEWITERLEGPGAHAWDTHEHDTVHWRDDGYPASLPKTMIVGKLVLRASAGTHGPQGNFTLLYDGEGELRFKLVKYTVHYNGKGRMVIEFHEQSGGIFIQIMRTNPNNPIHNIRLILPGFEDRHELFPFYPPFVENLKRYSEIRFMDFMHTNGHKPEPTTWASRRTTSFHTQTGEYGAAIEYAIQLVNILGANPWFCQPHAADDDFATQFATLAMAKLRPELKIYLEYSNEVWNGIFRQAVYSKEQGMALKLDTHDWKAGFKYYNKRSIEVMKIWKQVFGSHSDRLVPTWAWQTGYQDFTRQALADLGSGLSEFKAIAVTGYFSCDRVTYKHNITSLSVQQVSQLCKDEVPHTVATFQHYMELAKNHSVKLLMYEGGPGLESSRTHDDNVTTQAISFNRHSLMELAVNDDLESWYSVVGADPYNTWPGGLFNYFSSVSAYSKYGSWGMLEYTGQNPYDSPKYIAVHKYINKHFNDLNYGPSCTFIISFATSFGCFLRQDQQYHCGTTSDRGASWKLYPARPANITRLILDGYDVLSHKIYIRQVDNLNVAQHLQLNTKAVNPDWQIIPVFDYYAQLASAHVIRAQPQGVHPSINTNQFRCPSV